MSAEPKTRVLYENLDTSFVNLWALLRTLTQREFIGRVRVELNDYTADVFMTGSSTPLVHEIDRAAGTDTLEEAALHRLVLRAREAPGSISVFEGADEAVAAPSAEATSPNEPPVIEPTETPPPVTETTATIEEPLPTSFSGEPESSLENSKTPVQSDVTDAKPKNEIEWSLIVQTSGELIGGVERALTGAGADFASLFRAARLELADDYTFLDPTSGHFEYANSVVTADEMPASSYVAGVSEVLRRVVGRVATGDRARRLRERVALELALLARKRNEMLERSGFREQLDRIAGTKVT